jgi:hypothetical protein
MHTIKVQDKMEVLLHSFLTSAPDGDEQLASWPSKCPCFPLNRGTQEMVWMFLKREKTHAPTRNPNRDSLIIQATAESQHQRSYHSYPRDKVKD